MKKATLYRGLFYILGLLVLALGLTLNTKTGLGVSPIISVAYSTSEIFHQNFGDMTLALYTLFVAVEMILHLIREKRRKKKAPKALIHAGKRNLKLVLLMDFLQIPLSLIFTRFLNLFLAFLPDLYSGEKSSPKEMTVRILFLLLAIILTGIGAAMSLNMRVIPNPGDGIVQAIADCIHKSVGFTKNCVDLTSIAITSALSLSLSGHLVGIGLGTVLAMIGVGRIIALFNHFFYEKMRVLSGVEV